MHSFSTLYLSFFFLIFFAFLFVLCCRPPLEISPKYKISLLRVFGRVKAQLSRYYSIYLVEGTPNGYWHYARSPEHCRVDDRVDIFMKINWKAGNGQMAKCPKQSETNEEEEDEEEAEKENKTQQLISPQFGQ